MPALRQAISKGRSARLHELCARGALWVGDVPELLLRVCHLVHPLLGAVFGFLNTGGVIQNCQQQLEGRLHVPFFRSQTRQTKDRIQRHRRTMDFSRDAQ